MTENTINQRLKILVESLGLNVRSFSKRFGTHEGNLRNYIDRGSKPPAEFIASIIQSIDNINPRWLLLGEGEMFLSRVAESPAVYQKISGGNNVGHNSGTGTVTQTSHLVPQGKAPENIDNMFVTPHERELLQGQIRILQNQLADKERIIQLLERQLNLPS